MAREDIDQKNVRIVKYKPSTSKPDTPLHEIHLAKTPIELTHEGKIYRVVPLYPNMAVSADGHVINARTHDTRKPYDNGGYYQFQTYNAANKRVTNITVHRLTALAWLDNADYNTKNVVDHINQDTHNNAVSNLRWVKHSDNVRLGIYDVLDKFSLYNTVTKKTELFSSVTTMAASIETGRKAFRVNRLPRIYTHKGVDHVAFITDDTIVPSELYDELRYAYRVTRTDDPTHYKGFNSTREMGNSYGIGKYSGAYVIEKLTKMGYTVTDKHAKAGGRKLIDIKNLNTKEECTGLTIIEVAKKLNKDKDTIYSRLNIRWTYGQPIGDWVLKPAEVDKYTLVIVPKQLTVVATTGLTKKVFQSIKEAARYYLVAPATIRNRIHSRKVVNGLRLAFGAAVA